MSWARRLHDFCEELPHTCLYCAHGFLVVFGLTDWTRVLVCNHGQVAAGVRGVRALPKALRGFSTDNGGQMNAGRIWLPLVGDMERCAHWAPLAAGDRKFELLDRSGVFDDVREEK